MSLPYDITIYSFVLQSVINNEYVYTRSDNYIVVINPEKQYLLIRYYNINAYGNNTELFRGWISEEADFATVLGLVKP